MTFNELRDKDVVNICSGKILGFVCDADFDKDCGKICAVFVSEKFFSVNPAKNLLRIPWDKIRCIGEDTVLVSIDNGDCDSCRTQPPKKEKNKCGRGWLF